MKALHVHNARPSEKIYIKLKESDDDAENYVSMDQHICVSQAAVAGARVGEGFIVYRESLFICFVREKRDMDGETGRRNRRLTSVQMEM